MLKLIVNADDLGTGNATDRGIFQAFRQGVVTSASLLATGPTARQAATKAGSQGLPYGVHLNLSEGRAISGRIRGLTDAEGRFPGKHRLREILAGEDFDRDAVAGELRAQLSLACSFGGRPDHLDTHQHCFLWPALTRPIIDLARQYDIRALRCPVPVGLPDTEVTAELAGDLSDYRQLGAAALTALRASGLSHPDGLLGMELLNRLDQPRLLELLVRLPEQGCLELMVHPGYRDPANPFDGPQREIELAALCSPETLRALDSRKIELIDFGNLPCAS